jgi:hypothetical protein
MQTVLGMSPSKVRGLGFKELLQQTASRRRLLPRCKTHKFAIAAHAPRLTGDYARMTKASTMMLRDALKLSCHVHGSERATRTETSVLL